MARLVWIASERGSAIRLSEGNHHTAQASARRGSGVLARRCVLCPPHSASLLPLNGYCLLNWSTPVLSASRKQRTGRLVAYSQATDGVRIPSNCDSVIH
jgi:hypothetical protein